MATQDEPTRAERLEADIRRLMAELATFPATGPTAWQFRETRRRISTDIEFAFQALDVVRDVDGDPWSFFDSEVDAL